MRLPNAPLTEVIFELHWQVIKTGLLEGLVNFGYDPGFAAFESAFTTVMDSVGYTAREVVAQPGPTFANKVVTRFRKGDGQPYPIIQIGHGILACNVSTDYEWTDFKAFCLEALEHVLACYPTSPEMPFRPSRIELKYTDIFNESLLKHWSITKFLNSNSKLSYDGLGFLDSEVFAGTDEGRMVFQRSIADAEIGRFLFELGSAKTDIERNIMLRSQVVKDADFASDWTESTSDRVADWLSQAHDITSKFFSSFISDDLMELFKENS